MSTAVLAELLESIERCEVTFAAREPQIQAFLPEPDRFDRLRREAEELLARYPDVHEHPPLLGSLVGVKDIFHVDGFDTRAGSRLPPEVLRGEEAEIVRRLKDAGALILGKTVTTEFAYFAPGPTRNPRELDYTPGGSSSGSAAGVAAGLCTLALGTQTIGSIIRPAAFCGVVGLKPSYGRVSREGVIPLSPSLDHVGLFGLDVDAIKEAVPLLYEEWREGLPPRRKPVLGIPDGPYLHSASAEGLEHFEAVCQRLDRAGYELRHANVMANFEDIRARHNLIVAAEAARVHADWFKGYADLYAPKTAELIRRGQSVTEAELGVAMDGRARLRSELTQVMDEHGLDLWASPSAPGPAPRGLESTGDPVMNLPWTQAGLPALNLPAGLNDASLPLGLQLVGGYGQDELLLAWAGELEGVLREP
jgi:Asp-tRNA(Asn)/Glu-tRNA(Gln) amidotransferase A subunit family amidase